MEDNQTTNNEDPQQQPPANAEAQSAPEEDVAAKCAEYKSGWQRAVADYANLTREMTRQRDEFSKFACADLITLLLPTVEALRNAAAHEPKPPTGVEGAAVPYPPEVTQWMQGIAAIRAQLDNALKKAGVEPIDQVGVPFDPAIHDAMMTKKVEGMEAHQVVEVLEAGCKLHDRVIKPAKVSVSE